MKKNRLSFFQNRILFSILLPVLLAGLIISAFSIYYLTPPLLLFMHDRTDTELKLASDLGLKVCENHFNYLLDLRLENSPEMNTTLKKEALEQIKMIGRQFHKINMLIVEDNRTVLGSSLDLQKKELIYPKFVKGKSNITMQNFWGDPIRIHYRYFPFWNWHIISLVSEKDYMAPILMAKKIVYLGTLGLLIVVLLTLFLVFNFFVNSPLRRVIRATAGIAEGRFKKVDIKRKDEIGQLGFSFNSMVDSLDKKNAEVTNLIEALKTSENRFRTVFQTSPDVITITRLDNGVFVDVNEAFTGLTGYTREEVIGISSPDIKIWHDPGERDKFIEALKRDGLVNNLETKFRLKDGSTRTGLVSSRIIELNGISHILFIVRDIHELKLAEEALRKSEEKYRALVDSSTDAILMMDKKRTIVSCNQAFLNLFGYDKNEVEGKSIGIIHPSDESFRSFGEIAYPFIDKFSSFMTEWKFVRKDGTNLFVETVTSKIYSTDGSTRGYVAIIRDIADRKRLEEQLRHAQKMEAIGTLAGGVAHDLNNILSGLASYPELLLMDLSKNSPLRKPLLTIQKSGEKAATIVNDLLTLARRGVTVTEVVDLNDTVSEYLASPEHEKLQSLHKNIQFEPNISTDLLNILGSPVHLSKTVMNLASNAAEAMPVGGKVLLSTKNLYVDRPIRGYDSVDEGDYVVLIVSDTGVGITPKDMKRIFEPFYTKKVMGRSGSGLGMAVVWGTVKDHKGYIDVKSVEGRGTTFSLYFPVTRKESAKAESHLHIEDLMGRGESVLVVDDVEEQREIASGILNKLGYSVTSVSSGEEAVDFMNRSSADLLVLDMIMDPGIDGLDTYKQILDLHPDQKAIIASGFSETDRVKELQRLGAGAYLKKPYTLEKMGMAVKTELEKKTA